MQTLSKEKIQYKGGTSDYGLNRSPGEQILQLNKA